MKLTVIPNEFKEAVPVLRQIQKAGFEAYFVGGSVRDALLGKKIHDVDIATSAFPSEIKEIFPRTIDVGIQHGTVMVLAKNQRTYEITTFRTESAYQDFRRPDHVEFVRSLEEDLRRRDFTINAFALKEDGEIIDLFDGLTDLKEKILRAVGDPHERFHEDALRMMRGLRFLSDLGFEFEKETFDAILENHALLEKISVERINVEFTKLMLGSFRTRALQAFAATECYQYCPGLKENSQALLDFAELPDLKIPAEAQAWTLLVYFLKLKKEEISHFLKGWKCSNQLIREVQSLTKGLHFRLHQDWSKLMLYQLGDGALQKVEALMPFFGKENAGQKAAIEYQTLPIHCLKELAVTGADLLQELNPKGGKWVSEVLKTCETAVVCGELENDREAVMSYVRKVYETFQ